MGSRRRRARIPEDTTPLLGTVVLVPARNEEEGLLTGLESIARQTSPPDLIVVIVNNSTDSTEKIAYDFAARSDVPETHVLVLSDNPHKKAGALNAGIEHVRNLTGHRLVTAARYLVVMDADTELHPSFLMRAERVISNDDQLGGVSAACRGRHIPPRSLWQRCLMGMQRIEYGRFVDTRMRRNVHTMSGAGSLYRTAALQDLLDWRGEVFWQNPRNLVEDYETTLALKESGWRCTTNQWCIAYTDLMPTLRSLIKQRERWVRGTVDTLRQRGITRHTWFSIGSIILGLICIPYTAFWAWATATGIYHHGLPEQPVYISLFCFWSVYLAYTARHLGWRSILVEALVIPEVLYNLARMYWLVTSVTKSYLSRRRPAAWAE